MTRADLVGLLAARYEADFADRVAARVLAAGAVGLLYGVVTGPRPAGCSAAEHRRLCFRGAYVLERLFFAAPEAFRSVEESFLRTGFVSCPDGGARRHFAKIMAHLLPIRLPEPELLEPIAAAAARWIVEPGTKVAVRVWCMEVLKCCRGSLPAIGAMWDDLVAVLEREASPGILARLRSSWRGDTCTHPW